MKTDAEKIRDLIQSKLPQTSVFWDPAPGIFGTEPCKLCAVNIKNPERNGWIRYLNGFPNEPIESLVEDFIAHIGPDVT